MNNPDMAKVMYPMQGKPMVEYVTELAAKLQAERTRISVGWQKESRIGHISKVEYYLTDVFEFFGKNQYIVSAVKAIDSIEVIGINDPAQLEAAIVLMASRGPA